MSEIGKSTAAPFSIARGRGEGRGERRTKEESDKNEFGSQDGQEMPNSRERIARKTVKLVYRHVQRGKDEWTKGSETGRVNRAS